MPLMTYFKGEQRNIKQEHTEVFWSLIQGRWSLGIAWDLSQISVVKASQCAKQETKIKPVLHMAYLRSSLLKWSSFTPLKYSENFWCMLGPKGGGQKTWHVIWVDVGCSWRKMVHFLLLIVRGCGEGFCSTWFFALGKTSPPDGTVLLGQGKSVPTAEEPECLTECHNCFSDGRASLDGEASSWDTLSWCRGRGWSGVISGSGGVCGVFLKRTSAITLQKIHAPYC